MKTRARRAAVLGIAVLSLRCAPAGQTQIHLGWSGDPSTSMAVTWRSPLASGSVLYWGMDGRTREQPASSEPFGGDYLHRAELSGLAPGSHYQYRCKGLRGPPQGGTFTAAPAPGSRSGFRFAVLGDSRSDDTARRQVRAAVQARSPAFALFTGDLVADGRSQKQWDEWFEAMQPLISRIPLMSAVGNHEANSPLYFQQLASPAHAPSAEGYDDRAYYSFDYGFVHFVAVSTEPAGGPEGEQARWLEADLARAAADPAIRWIIAFGHRPPYSSGNHGSDLAARATFAPLFERYRVRLAFWGHDHDYERTKPLIAGREAEGGVVYVVTGGAGAPLYSVGASDFTAASASAYHFVEVSAGEAELRVETRGVSGQVFDSVVIH